MLKTVRAIYEDGKIKLLGDIGAKRAKQYIVVVGELNDNVSLNYTKLQEENTLVKEVISLPIEDEWNKALKRGAGPESGWFEVITPDGEQIKMSNWTDEEWERFSLDNFMNTVDDRDVDWEDFFSVKNRRLC